MEVYRIKNWVEHFETAKTLEYNRCQRITFTNRLNKIQRKRLLKSKDGPGYLAVWFSVCQYHSSQSKPRTGYLTENGKPESLPLNAADLADLIGLPTTLVKSALDRLSEPDIGWMEKIPVEVGVTGDQPETAVGDQSSSLISPLHSTPLHSTINDIPPTPVSIYLAIAKRFHEHQRVNFPQDSVLLRNPDKLDADGALELERFERINGWTYDKIVEVLKRVLDDPKYRKNIISLRTVRKSMPNGSMKLENADKYAKAPKPGFGNFFDGIENVLEEAYPDAD